MNGPSDYIETKFIEFLRKFPFQKVVIDICRPPRSDRFDLKKCDFQFGFL